jgi:hypothetical protein
MKEPKGEAGWRVLPKLPASMRTSASRSWKLLALLHNKLAMILPTACGFEHRSND